MTPNLIWKKVNSVGFFKNCPVGKNGITKCIKAATQQVGLDTVQNKITNHSNCSIAVSCLAKSGVGQHQITKMTGHQSTSSIKSFLQLDVVHHRGD